MKSALLLLSSLFLSFTFITAQGGILDTDQDTLNFGNVFVNQTANRNLLIRNIGSQPLSIGTFFFTNGRYTIDTSSLLLPGNGSYLATITYSPTSMGASNGNLEMYSNTGQFLGSVHVRGTGVDIPEANFDTDNICVNLITGEDTTATLVLANDGLGDLNYEFNLNFFPSWLTAISPSQGTVPPGESTTLSFTFSAAGVLGDTYTFPLQFNNNEPANPNPVIEMKMIVQSLPESIPTAIRTTVCDGIVEFVDQSLYTATSWAWDFGDGNTSTEQNPTHTYATDGQYIVTLVVCNDIGCDTATVNTPINVALDGSLCEEFVFVDDELLQVTGCGGVFYDNGGADGNYTNGFNGQLLITSLDGAPLRLVIEAFLLEGCCDFFTVYDGADASAPQLGRFNGTQLSPGDAIASSGDQLFITFTSDGSVVRSGFQVRYECFINLSPPTASFEASTAATCDGMVDFVDSSTDNPATWAWDFGDGNTSTEQNPSHLYTTTGQYLVSLEVCNEFGCDEVIADRSINVSLEEDICQEIPFVDDQQVDVTGCGGRILDAGLADGNYTNGFNGQLLLTSGAGERLRLIVDDFRLEFCCDFFTVYDGADASAPQLGRYNGIQLLPGDEIESSGDQLFITFTSDGSVTSRGFDIRWECINNIGDVTLSATPQVACPATIDFMVNNTGSAQYTYSYVFGDGESEEAGINHQHTYPGIGSYEVELTLTGNGQSRVIAQTVDVLNVNFELSIAGPTEILTGQEVAFAAQAPSQLANYDWYAEGTEVTSSAQTILLSWSEPGVYRIWLDADNGDTNCEGRTFVDVTVNLDTRANNDHATVTGLDVFPNPTRNQLNFNLQLERNLDLSYRIVDATGRQVLQNQVPSLGRELTERLDVSTLPAGIYHFTLFSHELGQVATRRFVKQ